MGQCVSSSNAGVAPEPPPPVPMRFIVTISNERKKRKIADALLRLVLYGEGYRSFRNSQDGLEISMRGNFVPATIDMCLHKYERYVEIEHLDHHVEEAT